MQLVTISKNQSGQRLDKFLKKYLPNAGSSFLYKMLRKKNITLNNQKAAGSEMLVMGDEVRFFFAEETFAKFAGRDSDSSAQYVNAYQRLKGITVLYENDDILLLNKPMGILTQKAAYADLSLNEWLTGYLLSCGKITPGELSSFHPSVCNRLDRNTSGIVLCGKTLAGTQALSRIIREHSLKKFYHTICLGTLRQDIVLEGYLKKDAAANKVSISDIEENHSSYIKTAFHILRKSDTHTLLEVELFTGKTHQIRAHLSDMGHPIIGDAKYGSLTENRRLSQMYGLNAQLLHAHHVVFPTQNEGVLHELSGQTITAPYPAFFEKLQKNLGLADR